MIFGGCARRLIGLVLLVALGTGLWLFRERIRMAWHELRQGDQPTIQPSPEIAAVAESKLQALRDGSRDQAALSAVELQSLLQYRYEGVLPAFLHDPVIEMRNDQLRLRARVPVDNLPHVEGLIEAAAFLPDTAEMAVTGKLFPLGVGRVAFGIDEVTAARVPLPRRFVPGALERIGRRDEPGLPSDAIALPLPTGVAAVYVRRDSLILLARPAGASTDRNDR